MSVIFKDLPGYEGLYSISICGKVLKHKSVRRNRQGWIHHEEKIMKPFLAHNGYICVSLIKEGKREKALLHRLLALTFLKRDEDRNFINHKDGDKTNYNINNLEWCTPKENLSHASKMGLLGKRKGLTNGHSKLSEFQVLAILSTNKKFTAKHLAKTYNVSKSTIDRINCGTQYKDVTLKILDSKER